MSCPRTSTGPSRYLTVPWSSQVMSGLSVGAALRLAFLFDAHEYASNWACSAGVTHARSLPFVGLLVGVDCSPGAGVGAGVDLPSAPTTSLVGPPAISTGRKSRRALDLTRSSVAWSGLPGRETTMLREPSVEICASETPDASMRWRMIDTAW